MWNIVGVGWGSLRGKKIVADDVSHLHHELQIDRRTVNDDGGIVTLAQSTDVMLFVHDGGRGFGSHSDYVSQWYSYLQHCSLDESVHGRDTSCQGRVVCQLSYTVFDDDTRVECLVGIAR